MGRRNFTMRVCAALLLASVLAASENSKPPVEEVVAKLDELVQVAQYLKRVATPLLRVPPLASDPATLLPPPPPPPLPSEEPAMELV